MPSGIDSERTSREISLWVSMALKSRDSEPGGDDDDDCAGGESQRYPQT